MKVKVFSAMRWICVFLLTLVIIAWTLIIIFGGLSETSVVFWCPIILFTIIMPFALVMINVFAMENILVFDNQGISRIRFGKTIRRFNWEEIQTISTTTDSSYNAWIYLSNEIKAFDLLSSTRMMLDKKVIYLHASEKAKTAILTYAPAHLKEKIAKLK